MSSLGNYTCKTLKTPYLTENRKFKYTVLYETSYLKEEDEEIKTFLKDVLIKTDKRYYIFVDNKFIDGKKVCNIGCSYDNYINWLSKMANLPYNVYYSIAAYTDWRDEDSVVDESIGCIYIDIDDLDTDISDMDSDELLEYIQKRCNLKQKPSCQWLVKSGKGCHFYFKTDVIDDVDYRNNLVRNMTTTFQADRSHFVRLPKSFNAKRVPLVKSTLYKINDNDEKPERLEEYLCSDEAVEDYFLTKEAERQNKIKKTIEEKKGKCLDPITEPTNESKISDNEMHNSDDENVQLTIAENKEYEIDDIEGLEIIKHYDSYYTDKRTWAYRELQAVKDLIIWLDLRDGNIEGKRHNYCVCFASKAYRIMSEDKCISVLSELLPDYPLKEIESTVKSVYKKDKFDDKSLKIKNKTIFKMLGIELYELEYLNCCYIPECKNLHRKVVYHKTQGKITAMKKSEQIEYIRLNMDSKNKDLAKDLNCSESTVKRIKRSIREGVA